MTKYLFQSSLMLTKIYDANSILLSTDNYFKLNNSNSHITVIISVHHLNMKTNKYTSF